MAFNPNEHLMDLKGKDYLQVMWRLVWFREEKPLWCIDTKLEQLTDNHAVFSAKISDENGNLKASGYGSEGVKDFRDFIEKAETKAIGRALAMLGYGTQFAPELDEESRIVDSPVAKKPMQVICTECGEIIKPYKNAAGKTVSVEEHIQASMNAFGQTMCQSCCLKKLAQQNTELIADRAEEQGVAVNRA